ncbi:MAG: MBL fold metallo-hydrolase [Candidatus Eisenbacteria bacterium]
MFSRAHDSSGGSSTDDLAARIDWLGHSSFRVRGSRTVYIDPWRIGKGPHAAPDLVLITHPHADHCSPSDLARLPGIEDAEIVTVADASRKLSRSCRVIEPGDRITVRGLNVTALPAYNIGKPHHPRSNRWVGFLVEMDGRTIYHAGTPTGSPR